MRGYEKTVEFVRKQQIELRRQYNEDPPTTTVLVNILLSMKHWSAAEWLLEQEVDQ